MNDPNTGQFTARELFQDIEESVNKMFLIQFSFCTAAKPTPKVSTLEIHYKNVMLKLKHAETTCIDLYDGLQNTCNRIEAKVV